MRAFSTGMRHSFSNSAEWASKLKRTPGEREHCTLQIGWDRRRALLARGFAGPGTMFLPTRKNPDKPVSRGVDIVNTGIGWDFMGSGAMFMG